MAGLYFMSDCGSSAQTNAAVMSGSATLSALVKGLSPNPKVQITQEGVALATAAFADLEQAGTAARNNPATVGRIVPS